MGDINDLIEEVLLRGKTRIVYECDCKHSVKYWKVCMYLIDKAEFETKNCYAEGAKIDCYKIVTCPCGNNIMLEGETHCSFCDKVKVHSIHGVAGQPIVHQWCETFANFHAENELKIVHLLIGEDKRHMKITFINGVQRRVVIFQDIDETITLESYAGSKLVILRRVKTYPSVKLVNLDYEPSDDECLLSDNHDNVFRWACKPKI